MTLIAIYDMDRTITRRGTYIAWLLFWAWRRAPWRLLLLPATGMFGAAYLLGLIDRGRLKEASQALLMGAGVTRADVDEVAAAFADRVAVLPGALAQIARDRAEGRRLVMATASYAFYAEAIGRRVDIADIIATRSVWTGDRLVARIDGENCYGAAKRSMVDVWLARLSRPPVHVRAYSDHVSDAPLFERADEAVATTPSPKLRSLAKVRGWRIVDWR